MFELETCKWFGMPIPVATQSKAWVCGHSLAGITGANPISVMDVCFLKLSCVVR